MNSREEEVARRERKPQEFTRGHRQHVAFFNEISSRKNECAG